MTAKASEGNEDKNHLFKNQTWFVEDWKENSKGFENEKKMRFLVRINFIYLFKY